MLLYLGKQHDNQYVFYTCAAAYLAFDDCDEYTLANYEVQVKYISEVCKALLCRYIYKESLHVRKLYLVFIVYFLL